MRLSQRMSLLRAADIAIVTSLRDGLARMPLEFAVAHQDALNYGGETEDANGGYRPGVIILSEFSSCCRVMRGAINVNPWRISEIAFAIERALCMRKEEHAQRVKFNLEFVFFFMHVELPVSTAAWTVSLRTSGGRTCSRTPLESARDALKNNEKYARLVAHQPKTGV